MTARVEIGERGIARAGLTIGFLLAGLLAMHWPMLSSGFARVQFDEGDTRINLYALEHGYRWISGQRHHERLWSPPVYYPLEWTAPCTETLVGVGPAFWVWRAMGAAPDTAYQLWLLSVSALNFLLALTWLRRGRRLPLLASLVGSWLIAFAASRAAQLNHPQLLAACYPLLALLLIDLLPRSRRKSLLLLALGGTVVGQLYAGTYVFLFAGLLGLAGLSILALDPVGRSRLREVLGGQKAALALVLVLAAAAALPWLHASWRASALKGYPSPWEVGQMIPRLASWLSPNPDNVVYGGLATSRPFAGLPMAHEHHLFLGLVTTVVGVGGLLLTRSQMSSRALGGAAAALILLTTALPTPESGTAAWITDAAIPVGLASLTWIGCTWDRRGGASRVAAVCLAAWLLNFGLTGGLSLWTSFCDLAPPLRAIRAVSRVGMLLAIPLGLGVAIVLARLRRGAPGIALGIGLGLLCMAEQVTRTQSFDKQAHRDRIARIAAEVPPDADVFYYSPLEPERGRWLDQLDAMFVHLQLRMPTINGNLNVVPWEWAPLAIPDLQSAEDAPGIEAGLARWRELHPEFSELEVRWVRVSWRDGGSSS